MTRVVKITMEQSADGLDVYAFRLDQVRSLNFSEETAETTVEYVDDDGNSVTLTMLLEPGKFVQLVRAFGGPAPYRMRGELNQGANSNDA